MRNTRFRPTGKPPEKLQTWEGSSPSEGNTRRIALHGESLLKLEENNTCQEKATVTSIGTLWSHIAHFSKECNHHAVFDEKSVNFFEGSIEKQWDAIGQSWGTIMHNYLRETL